MKLYNRGVHVEFPRRSFIPEGSVVAKICPEGILFNIECSALLAQSDHLSRLQRCHLLFGYCSLLPHTVPSLWQLLWSDRQKVRCRDREWREGNAKQTGVADEELPAAGE